MTTSKKKKKESIFMRKSFLKVWTGKDGKAYSKARGSLSQNINNYNTMITYLREQANAMAGSATMMLGQAPDVIIGTMEKQPRITSSNRPSYPVINPGPSPNSMGK